MAVTELSAILKDIVALRIEDVPKLVKTLGSLGPKLKHSSCMKEFQDQSEEARISMVKLSVDSYCHALMSARLARALDKMLRCCPKVFVDCVNQQIEIKLKELLEERGNSAHLQILSSLLDQNAVVKKASESHFEALSHYLKDNLSSYLNYHDQRHQKEDEYLRYSVKLCVQALQLFSQRLKRLFAHCVPKGSECDTEESCKLIEWWKGITLALLKLLMLCKNKDVLLLTGTALAMLLNFSPTHDMIASGYMDVIAVLSHEKEVIHIFGSLVDVTILVPKIPSDTSVPLTAIIKGMLVSCDKDVLSKGDNPLILQCFSYSLQLCQGPTVHHYLAFQLLSLWYQKLEQIGQTETSVWDLNSVMDRVMVRDVRDDSSEKNASSGDSCFLPVVQTDRVSTSEGTNAITDISVGNDGLSDISVINACSPKNDRDAFSSGSNIQSIIDVKQVTSSASKQLDCTPVKSSCCASKSAQFMSKDCPVLRSTLSCIWLNFDSPVDGVSEFVMDVFAKLLSVWHHRVKKGNSDNASLCERLMERVLSMAWHTRTRYRPLSILLPYIDCKQLVHEKPQLKSDLMRCMKTNHMAAVASDVYKVFLKQIICQDEDSALQSWQQSWMSTLLTGLTSTDWFGAPFKFFEDTVKLDLQSLKTCLYWLPPTMTLIPGSHSVLLSSLEEHLSSADIPDRDQWLYAWVTVSRTSRELLHSFPKLEATHLLREALFCDDESIRSETFMYLCSTVRKSEPMTEVEAELLKESIPANLKTDSAPFRQNLTSALRKMMVRIRDSCLSAVRNNRTGESFLDISLCFIDWLYHLLMLSLAPGGAYQRRQTTFDILVAMLETLIYQDQDTAKKGKAQESSQALLQFAHSQGIWDFFSDESFITVLTCLEDGAEEIQTQCYKLLLKYFHWPKTSEAELTSLLTQETVVTHLLNRALALTSSPRAHENHSGLLMMSLVLNRYVLEMGVNFVSKSETLIAASGSVDSPRPCLVDISHDEKPGEERDASDSASAFLDMLVNRAARSLEAVRTDLATGFKHHPIHGLTQYITRCLLEVSKNVNDTKLFITDKWRKALEEIVNLNQELISFVLEVLAGGKALENCPSFADMGVALENLISGDHEQEEETMSLSPEFQLLLSWCWHNLRESCTCLGGVTSVAVTADGNCQLPLSLLTDVGQTFVKVLTTCRHRGAIEGCRGGLHQFSVSLMSSSVKGVSDIPQQILQQVLGSISENSLTSSVTRRSAGLPIIVQTVIQASRKSGKTSLLRSTVEHLYDVASKPLPADYNQQQDLSQSHALNILKIIFCDASLAPLLMPQLSKMTILVVKGFDSPSWAIRNAATQLISTLVTRLFGQKNKVDASSNMTLEEFATLYPELLQFAVDMLKTYMESVVNVRPSLYIVLTLLSSLGMSPSHQHSSSCRSFLKDATLFFLSNPVYFLRKLSAQAYIALSPLDEADETLRVIIQKLKGRQTGMNELHGWLLSAHCLLSSGAISSSMCQELLMFVVDNKRWLLAESSSCLLPTSTVIEITQLAVMQLKDDSTPGLYDLWGVLNSFISAVCSQDIPFQVDRDHCLQQCVKTMVAIKNIAVSTVHDCSSQFVDFACKGLSSSQPLLCGPILDCLHAGKEDLASCPSIQSAILQTVINEASISNLLQVSDIFVALVLKGGLHLQLADLQKLDLGTLKSRWSQVHNVEAAIFALEGVIFQVSTTEEIVECKLHGWCRQLLKFTEPSANENLRFTAAQSLRIAGAKILKFCCANRTWNGVDDVLSCVVKACLQLLEDTEAEVRHEAALFVSKLHGVAPLHYNLCYYVLSEIICEQLSWSSSIMSTLLELFYHQGELTGAIKSALATQHHALFEPETNSAMSEKFITQVWAYNTLQNILTRFGTEIIVPLLSSTVATSCAELKTNLPVIEDNLTSQPVFNISTDEKVITSLLGLHLLAHLHNTSKASAATSIGHSEELCEKSELNQLVRKLEQIPSLHPFLRKKKVDDSPVVCQLMGSVCWRKEGPQNNSG